MARRGRGPRRLTLDSGAVIALSRADQRARAFLARGLELGAVVEIPVVVVAETLRGSPRDTPVHRVLKAVGSVPAATPYIVGCYLHTTHESNLGQGDTPFRRKTYHYQRTPRTPILGGAME